MVTRHQFLVFQQCEGPRGELNGARMSAVRCKLDGPGTNIIVLRNAFRLPGS
jgi:hypothetical protein